MRARRVLFFSPFLPYPLVGGNRRRVLSMLDSLARLGVETHLISCRTAPADLDATRGKLVPLGVRVETYPGSSLDFRLGHLIAKVRSAVHPATLQAPSLSYSPFFRRWLQRRIDELDPDVVWMTYATWDHLLDHRRNAGRARIIDAIDLTSVIQPYLGEIERIFKITPWSTLRADSELLRDDYFERLGLRPDPEEFAIYDRYTCTLAISPAEAKAIGDNTSRTRVLYQPMAYDVPAARNAYDGGALLVLANAPVNRLGFAYFVKRVLPAVRERAPGFTVRVVGAGSAMAEGIAGCEPVGFVDDISAEYARARFALVPTVGATGQQVRIVEAMAEGVPVVTTEASGRSSPIVHGENGFIASDAAAFAEHVAHLWGDPAQCRRLGLAARETMLATSSQAQLTEQLGAALFGSGSAASGAP